MPQSAPQPTPPPRAFTQGTGLIFQVVGVSLFLLCLFICCGSSLLSRDFATSRDLREIGWHFRPGAAPDYTAQRAITVSLATGLFLGMAMAGLGLGMQADSRRAPAAAFLVTLFGMVFFLTHAAFAATAAHSALFCTLGSALTLLFATLCALAVNAFRDTRRNPPPANAGVLPADYKIPYSHYHVDPPEVRLARELDERRSRLAVEQKKVEALEQRIKKRLDEKQREENP